MKQGRVDLPGVSRPYVIAEAGVNHEGNMELAKQLIAEAADGGADAIKFQTYRADTIASRHSPAYWDTNKEPTKSQYELFQKYDNFWKKDYEELRKCCDVYQIEFLSTPFDVESVKFLNDMMDVFKISSSDITNKPFIKYICSFGKPIILSTGASNLDEIDEAVCWIDETRNPVALLHCILNYPTLDENAHLGMISSLLRHYPDRLVGYSDHTLPNEMDVLIVATLLGARILEKHFTHNKTLPGNDHYHAMDKTDLKKFLGKVEKLPALIGELTKSALVSEESSRLHARRSLVVKRNIREGGKIELSDITWKRPAHGISPKDIDDVVGKRASRDLIEDEILHWEMLR